MGWLRGVDDMTGKTRLTSSSLSHWVRHAIYGDGGFALDAVSCSPAKRFALRIDQATGLHSGVGLKKMKQSFCVQVLFD
jgi:hypothetical protein